MKVQQNITIHHLRINVVTNSSILQIGTAGLIKPLSNVFNTGGFTGPAPPLGEPGIIPMVPLPPVELR